MGRVMRSHPGKEFALWLDHSGNYLRFKNEWDELYSGGVSELIPGGNEKPKPEPTEAEKEKAKCPKCGSLWPSLSDTCAHCGHVRVRKNEVVEMPGQLAEISGEVKKEKYSAQYKEQWYQGMLALLRDRRKNENRAYHMYREKFGVAPCWKKQYGRITQDVINDLKRANIAFSMRKK
jgi:hypothetical protein